MTMQNADGIFTGADTVSGTIGVLESPEVLAVRAVMGSHNGSALFLDEARDLVAALVAERHEIVKRYRIAVRDENTNGCMAVRLAALGFDSEVERRYGYGAKIAIQDAAILA